MNFAQSTLEEIWESERLMLLGAKERYGQYWTHARTTTVFLSRCITAINHDRMMFGHFFSHMKKHHTLSLFSAVRLHKVQAMMDLRQVLEAGASAAFALAKPEREHFADADDREILDPSQPLTKKRYAWLDTSYPAKSQWIKETKNNINQSAAHANIVSASNVFRVNDAADQASAPFFDIEDDYHVKCDLWLIAAVALTLMDLFAEVNDPLKVIEFNPDFLGAMRHYAAENNALLDEMKQTGRFKETMTKYGLALKATK